MPEAVWDQRVGESHDDLWEPWADTVGSDVYGPERLAARGDEVFGHELVHVVRPDLDHCPWWHFDLFVGHPVRIFWRHGYGVTRAHAKTFRATGRVSIDVP